MFNAISSQHVISPSFLEKNFKSLYSDYGTSRQNTRPSASSSLCPRQIGLTMNVPPRTIKVLPTLADYASIGNTIEDNALSKYRKSGQLHLSQWKIPEELTSLGLDVGGIIDAFLMVNGELLLIDIKTVGSVDTQSYVPLQQDEVTTLMTGGEITISSTDERIKQTVEKGVKDTHIAQLQLYAAVTGLDNVYIQLLSRRVQDTYTTDGSPSVKFEQVPITLGALENRVAIVHYALRCLQLGFIPDKLKGIKKTTCGDAFCNFQDYCWKGEIIDTSLLAIDEKVSMDLKRESLGFAQDYMSRKEERKLLTLELIEKERVARMKKGKPL